MLPLARQVALGGLLGLMVGPIPSEECMLACGFAASSCGEVIEQLVAIQIGKTLAKCVGEGFVETAIFI